jgi:SAM-dependent methyltransferase
MAFSIARLWGQIKNWTLGDSVEKPIAEQIPHLTEWFKTPCGKLLLETEQAAINQSLPAFFGYHLMQMSIHQEADLGSASPIHHRIHLLGCRIDETEGKKSLLADFDALPLESDSIDVIILHHVLEFSLHPHQILKEVNRVLIPRGHVIIVGFNPFSLMGLWRGVASRMSRHAPWHYHALTKWRLQDWFKFLDLNKTQITDTFYRPPCSSPLLLNRFSFMESLGKALHLPFGGSYVMVARKDVNAVTPIRGPWEKISRRLPSLATARPVTPRSYISDHSLQKKKDLH